MIQTTSLRLRTAAAIAMMLASWNILAQGTSRERSQVVQPVVSKAYVFLHENPEVGLKELEASKYIRAELQKLPGFKLEPVNALPTAVVAVFNTGRPGPVRAFRAELDGRKLDDNAVEPMSHSPRSKLDGFMHNCGHDVHASMLLGAAVAASNSRASLHGTLVFVFQPAEETRGGADDIVADGILNRLGVTALFAQHVAPDTPVGEVSLSQGTPLAGSWTYLLTLTGSASHAAVPFEGTDTAVVAARIAQELAAFPAHGLDIANAPVVIGVAKLKAEGPTSNALPGSATIEGSIRAFTDIARAAAGEQSVVD